MIMDEKGKLFGKVSIVDALIVVVVLAAVFVVGYRFTKTKTVSPFVKTSAIEMQFLAEEAPDYAAKAIKVGDAVTDFEKGSAFGKVSEVKVDKSLSYGTASDGKIVSTSKQGYASVKVVTEGQGVYSGQGVTIDNTDYYIGRSIILRAGKSVIYARVCDISNK